MPNIRKVLLAGGIARHSLLQGLYNLLGSDQVGSRMGTPEPAAHYRDPFRMGCNGFYGTPTLVLPGFLLYPHSDGLCLTVPRGQTPMKDAGPRCRPGPNMLLLQGRAAPRDINR